MTKLEYMTKTELDDFMLECQMKNKNIVNSVVSNVKEYITQGYDINEELRVSGNAGDYQDTIEAIELAFSKMKAVKVPKSFCLFRGLASAYNYNASFKPGKNVVPDKALCSTTKAFDIAYGFMTRELSEETCCVLHIHFEKGQMLKMMPVMYEPGNAHEHEEEIIFPPGTSMEVIKDEELLRNIEETMSDYKYELGLYTYEDRFNDETMFKEFPFKVFRQVNGKNKNKKVSYIIPVRIK